MRSHRGCLGSFIFRDSGYYLRLRNWANDFLRDFYPSHEYLAVSRIKEDEPVFCLLNMKTKAKADAIFFIVDG